MHRQTPHRSAAGRIWSLFKSLNYSWLKIHGEPFIWKLGAVQAALWCLIGLKVANPLNKSGRRVVPACVLRMRMWVFTTHLLFIFLFFTVLLLCTVQWLLNLKKLPCLKQTNTVSLMYFDILESAQFRVRPTFVLVLDVCVCVFVVPGGNSNSGFPFGATLTFKAVFYFILFFFVFVFSFFF